MDIKKQLTDAREKSISALMRTETRKKFLSSPLLMVFDGVDNGIMNECDTYIRERVTNVSAIKTVRAGELPLAGICADFMDIASEVADVTAMKIIVVTNGADDFSEVIDEAADIKKLFPLSSVYNIAIMDELKTAKADIDAAMRRVRDFTLTGSAFVLQRKREDGKIFGSRQTQDIYVKIICSLALNMDDIMRRIGGENGIYTVGIASFTSAARSAWMNILEQADNGYVEKNKGVYISAEAAMHEFEKLAGEGYTNQLNINIFKHVLRNKSANTPAADMASKVGEVYGESLKIYLDNEKEKTSKAVEKIKPQIEALAGRLDPESRTGISMKIRGLGETQAAESIYNNEEQVFSFTQERKNYTSEIFNKYLMTEIKHLCDGYYKDLLDIFVAAIQKATDIENEMHKNILIQRDTVQQEIINYKNTNKSFMLNANTDFSVYSGGNYIEYLIAETEKNIKAAGGYELLYRNHSREIIQYIMSEAVPFSGNAGFGNIVAMQCVIGDPPLDMDEYAAVTRLSGEYEKEDFLLSLSEINKNSII